MQPFFKFVITFTKVVSRKMTKKSKIIVTASSDTGRNLGFKDTQKNRHMTRSTFVKAIKREEYPGYHIRKINGVETPVSNPDGNLLNNLD